MSSVGMNIDIATLVDATAAGDSDQIIAVGRELTQHGADASELIGRIGMIAAHGIVTVIRYLHSMLQV